MKKALIWTLVAIMTLGIFMTPARALEPVNRTKQITEDPRGRRPGRRPPPRPRPRPYRRYSNNGWGWAVGGAVIGGAIGSAIAGNNYYREPVLVCDYFGNCYYAYR